MSNAARIFSRNRLLTLFHSNFRHTNHHILSHPYCTFSILHRHQYTTNNNILPIFHHSQRFKRGAKGRKQAKQEDTNRPEVGTTLDSDDYKKRMDKHIIKFQSQLREIQPRTANTSVVENIEIAISGKKEKIKKIADVAMRGVSSIAILPHKPEDMTIIEEALIKFNEEFNPRIDTSSGLITVSVPKPNDEQLASLKYAVTTRRDTCKRSCQDLMKVAMNEAKRMSEYLPKDDVYEYNVALNDLIKEQQEKIDEMSNKKLKEFDA